MADLVDRVAARALRASDRLITGLAGATEAAAKRAATTSKSAPAFARKPKRAGHQSLAVMVLA